MIAPATREAIRMKLVHATWEPAGAGPFPTIFAMHGWGSNAMDLQGLAPFVADGRFLVICPQGSFEVEIGAINGYGWYQMRPGSQPDPEKVDAAVEITESDHPARPIIEKYKADMRRRFRKLARDMRARDADALGDSLMLLWEGSYLSRLTSDSQHGPAQNAVKAARTLIAASTV